MSALAAPANGEPALGHIADFVAPHSDAAGLADILEHYLARGELLTRG
jgi:hypothetical protein